MPGTEKLPNACSFLPSSLLPSLLPNLLPFLPFSNSPSFPPEPQFKPSYF